MDDEENVLRGIQNLLRKDRKRWDLVFALGGEAALAELDNAPFDVVVSDMRMPNMDGATLLARVKEKFPSVVRIVLSGYAEPEAMMRALPVAHQFLAKPCSAELLRATIERTCALRALFADEPLRQLVSSVDRLPTPPGLYWELMQATANPETGLADIGRIVERDPAVSARVLQLVNSSYFAPAQPIVSVRQAVTHLGSTPLRGLVLSAHVFSSVKMPPVDTFSVESLQSSSLRVACAARRLLSDPSRADEVFSAAIVHDLGSLVLALAVPERYGALLAARRESGQPLHIVEREALGVSHAEVGAYLLGLWGLPLSIVEAVAFHHEPSRIGEGPLDVLASLHAADLLVDADGSAAPEGIDQRFLARAGVLDELPRWRALAAA